MSLKHHEERTFWRMIYGTAIVAVLLLIAAILSGYWTLTAPVSDAYDKSNQHRLMLRLQRLIWHYAPFPIPQWLRLAQPT